MKFSGWDDPFACPGCGEPYLHQREVSVFCRGEDEPQMVCVSVDQIKGTVTPSIEPEENCPSPRRQALQIAFSCEHCHSQDDNGRFYLNIWQHKGCTYAAWNEEVSA